MNKTFFIFLFAVFQMGFSQKYRFVYEYKMVSDRTKPDSLTTDYMNLDTDGKKSYFYNSTKFETDSAYAAGNEFKVLANAKNFDLNLNYSVEKNQANKTTNFYTNYKGLEIVIPENDFPVWQLENEYQEIAKMRCQKAITKYKGRNWEAWFTTKIPVSDGPYKFSGLPGLVVKLYDTENQHQFELIQVKKLDDLYFKIPKNPKKMQAQKYQELMKNYSFDVSDIKAINVTSSGMSIQFNDGNYRNIPKSEVKVNGKKENDDFENSFRRTNNPIEL